MTEKKYYELLNHLIKNYRTKTLEDMFGISQAMWRQHKSFVDTKGLSGTRMSLNRKDEIAAKYKEFLKLAKSKTV